MLGVVIERFYRFHRSDWPSLCAVGKQTRGHLLKCTFSLFFFIHLLRSPLAVWPLDLAIKSLFFYGNRFRFENGRRVNQTLNNVQTVIMGQPRN